MGLVEVATVAIVLRSSVLAAIKGRAGRMGNGCQHVRRVSYIAAVHMEHELGA